jgi:hypothetical protein
MQYWIQRADFTSEEYEAVNVAEIQRAFRSRSWSGEVEFENRRREAGEESCPPGLGIVAGDGRILHLCPSGSDMVVHYHFPETKKLLGFLNSSRERTITADKELARAEELINLFVAADHKKLVKALES